MLVFIFFILCNVHLVYPSINTIRNDHELNEYLSDNVNIVNQINAISSLERMYPLTPKKTILNIINAYCLTQYVEKITSNNKKRVDINNSKLITPIKPIPIQSDLYQKARYLFFSAHPNHQDLATIKQFIKHELPTALQAQLLKKGCKSKHLKSYFVKNLILYGKTRAILEYMLNLNQNILPIIQTSEAIDASKLRMQRLLTMYNKHIAKLFRTNYDTESDSEEQYCKMIISNINELATKIACKRDNYITHIWLDDLLYMDPKQLKKILLNKEVSANDQCKLFTLAIKPENSFPKIAHVLLRYGATIEILSSFCPQNRLPIKRKNQTAHVSIESRQIISIFMRYLEAQFNTHIYAMLKTIDEEYAYTYSQLLYKNSTSKQTDIITRIFKEYELTITNADITDFFEKNPHVLMEAEPEELDYLLSQKLLSTVNQIQLFELLSQSTENKSRLIQTLITEGNTIALLYKLTKKQNSYCLSRSNLIQEPIFNHDISLKERTQIIKTLGAITIKKLINEYAQSHISNIYLKNNILEYFTRIDDAFCKYIAQNAYNKEYFNKKYNHEITLNSNIFYESGHRTLIYASEKQLKKLLSFGLNEQLQIKLFERSCTAIDVNPDIVYTLLTHGSTISILQSFIMKNEILKKNQKRLEMRNMCIIMIDQIASTYHNYLNSKESELFTQLRNRIFITNLLNRFNNIIQFKATVKDTMYERNQTMQLMINPTEPLLNHIMTNQYNTHRLYELLSTK